MSIPTRAAGRVACLAAHSVEIIRANQASSGAYVASPNFPVYRYSWLRDGAFIADAMSRAGEIESAEAFFAWCSRTLLARAGTVDALIARRRAGSTIRHDEFLPTRYTVEGEETGEPWTDFQLDGYGAWLWALDAHARRHARPLDPCLPGALVSARYITAFWDEPSFDWWEERPDERHSSTLAALHGGLTAVAGWAGATEQVRRDAAGVAGVIRATVAADAARNGCVAKWLGGSAVDASLLAVATPFRLLEPDDPLMAATLRSIEADLVRGGGVHRYLGDTYYGGGQWLLLAALLGWHYAEAGRPDDAWRELAWVADRALPDGEFPEQVTEDLLAPGRLAEWEERWGPIATPLLWSHAMFLTLALQLGVARPRATRG